MSLATALLLILMVFVLLLVAIPLAEWLRVRRSKTDPDRDPSSGGRSRSLRSWVPLLLVWTFVLPAASARGGPIPRGTPSDEAWVRLDQKTPAAYSRVESADVSSELDVWTRTFAYDAQVPARELAQRTAEKMGYEIDVSDCKLEHRRTRWIVHELPVSPAHELAGIKRRARLLRMIFETEGEEKGDEELTVRFEAKLGTMYRIKRKDHWSFEDTSGTIESEAEIIASYLSRLTQALEKAEANKNDLELRKTAPIPINVPQPKFPRKAKRLGLNEWVEAEMVIGKRGYVKDVTWLRGHPLFRKSTINTLRKWRFLPVVVDDRPIAWKYRLKVCFELK